MTKVQNTMWLQDREQELIRCWLEWERGKANMVEIYIFTYANGTMRFIETV
jgi:hypothetical protein